MLICIALRMSKGFAFLFFFYIKILLLIKGISRLAYYLSLNGGPYRFLIVLLLYLVAMAKILYIVPINTYTYYIRKELKRRQVFYISRFSTIHIPYTFYTCVLRSSERVYYATYWKSTGKNNSSIIKTIFIFS